MDMAHVIAVHNAIKAKRTELKRAYDEEDTKLEEDLGKLRAYMLTCMQNQGADSIKTAHGTVYRTEKLKPSAADWQAVQDWVIANAATGGFEIFEKRLKAAFVKDYLEQHNALPPGVNAIREYDVAVRRPNAKPSDAGLGE